MNSQQLKSKISSLQIPKATFENDESGEPVNSFFRKLTIDISGEQKQVQLKLKGTVNSPPKLYDSQFGKHFSFAVRVDKATIEMFDSLLKKLHEGSPEDEAWYSKHPATPKDIIIIKLPVNKKMEFSAKISGATVGPFNLDAGIEVGDNVALVVSLGIWYMRNKENKYGVSLTADTIDFGAVKQKRKKSEEDDIIIQSDSENGSVDLSVKKKKLLGHNKGDREVVEAMRRGTVV